MEKLSARLLPPLTSDIKALQICVIRDRFVTKRNADDKTAMKTVMSDLRDR